MAHKRTNIEIDPLKLKKAKKISGYKTTKEVVNYALERLIRSTQSLKELLNLKNKVHFDPHYNYKASR